jgi:hypothetical protein
MYGVLSYFDVSIINLCGRSDEKQDQRKYNWRLGRNSNADRLEYQLTLVQFVLLFRTSPHWIENVETGLVCYPSSAEVENE